MKAISNGAGRVVILGALSTIAEALGRQLAAEGASLVVAARHPERLAAIASDLEARGAASVVAWPIDLAKVSNARAELERMIAKLGGSVDGIVIIYGVLGDQGAAEGEGGEGELDRIVETNFSSAARWAVAAAGVLERQKQGTLLAVSSVAGDRGRQSNYLYGASKAGLTVLMEGIAHRLAPSGAKAVVVKLGFVDTAMTAHIKKGGPLWAKPDAVAARLKRLIASPTKPIVYLPWFWRPMMTIIRNIPTPVFHRTRL